MNSRDVGPVRVRRKARQMLKWTKFVDAIFVFGG